MEEGYHAYAISFVDLIVIEKKGVNAIGLSKSKVSLKWDFSHDD